jgi:hypothetical protein
MCLRAAVYPTEAVLALSREGIVYPLLLLAAHVPLALAMHASPYLGGLHGVVTLCIGLLWAGRGSRPELVGYIGAYITGSEVLWRMSEAPIPWEFAKYATAAIFILALLRMPGSRSRFLPIAYFVLLVPSIMVTVPELAFGEARREISFNMSGPFALMVSSLFFSRVSITRDQLRRLLAVGICPIVGVLAIALFSTLSASTIRFDNEANDITSGGFGPNQVSSLLGLGALMAFLLAIDHTQKGLLRLLMLLLLILFLVQSALTLSRGGLYMAVGGMLLASFWLLRNSRVRLSVICLLAILSIGAKFVILPLLDEFTEGAVSARFERVDSTGRDVLIQADVDAWKENPLLGLGPGRSRDYHELIWQKAASHTEFTRLLSEHGTLGLAALIILLLMGVQNLRRKQLPENRAIIVSMVFYSFSFMLINAMRLVAPAFTFGLGFLSVESEQLAAVPRRPIGEFQERASVAGRSGAEAAPTTGTGI